MKIAIMGLKEFVNRVKNIIKDEHYDVNLVPFYYTRYIEILDFLRNRQEEFDAILFPGHVSYLYAEHHLEKKQYGDIFL